MQAITTGMGRSSAQLNGLNVAVLGAGGVARAIVAGLCDAGAKVIIYNRTAARAGELARLFSCGSAPWNRRAEQAAELVVNCTRVGMAPDADASPLPAEVLRAGQAVFDTVYNPPRTKLLQQAADRGCRTIDGIEMFALQAAAQSELWTGESLPIAFFRNKVQQALATDA
jgi:shikimate 5-dehydrogenase